MEFSVYIRPLQLDDAEVSYKWRNNPKIWRFTGNRPDKEVTAEMEKEWLRKVLQRPNEKRFAICLKEDNTYIGNIYLTDIQNGTALIHIFIGDIQNWGRKRAFESILLICLKEIDGLIIHTIFAIIDKNNVLSKALASLFPINSVEEYLDEKTGKTMTKWTFTRKLFNECFDFNTLPKSY